MASTSKWPRPPKALTSNDQLFSRYNRRYRALHRHKLDRLSTSYSLRSLQYAFSTTTTWKICTHLRRISGSHTPDVSSAGMAHDFNAAKAVASAHYHSPPFPPAAQHRRPIGRQQFIVCFQAWTRRIGCLSVGHFQQCNRPPSSCITIRFREILLPSASRPSLASPSSLERASTLPGRGYLSLTHLTFEDFRLVT
ncbi:hypothetical protein BDY17DRAFT_25332 [Neohortaea acidophila]|uniref:Uncharacterized protein n=1 Tax=Neohortaea acidophila TaxID=245834 RepID=A0A6A6Q9V6_9PEZI|nr:uncharacterized protein BDY17DRAFT_25332 [Neohortaea acidophila]KAF2488197.1 hypothetical protein BDY17DRAFT_25332 [Neohortaea acidophila]